MASETNQSKTSGAYYSDIKQLGFWIILDPPTLKYVVRFHLIVPFHWSSAP